MVAGTVYLLRGLTQPLHRCRGTYPLAPGGTPQSLHKPYELPLQVSR